MPRSSLALPLGLLFILLAFVAVPATGQDPDDEPERDNLLSKVEPTALLGGFQEQFNGFSGQLQLRFQTVNLPGKGGLDLVVQHYYSSEIWNRTDQLPTHVASIDTTDHLGGGGWQLHMGKVINPEGNGSVSPQAPNNPLVVMPDGSTRLLYDSKAAPNELISEDRWRYKLVGASTWELTSMDGTVYEFTALAPVGASSKRGDAIAQCTKVTDVNGNTISIDYTGVGLIDEITDTWGRKVDFEYWSESDRIRYLRVKDDSTTLQQWEFKYGANHQLVWPHPPHGNREIWALTEVVPPEGDSWQFDYYPELSQLSNGSYMLEKVTLPTGGTLTYTWAGKNFEVGCQSGFPIQKPALIQRQTGGRDVVAGTWSYGYTTPGADGAVTTITGPLSTSETQTFEGFDAYSGIDAELWSVGRLRQRVVTNPLQTVTEDYTWEEGEELSFDYRLSSSWLNCGSTRQLAGVNFVKPTQIVRTLQRGTATYVTTQSAFDAYGNPALIQEDGDVLRSTELEYWYSTAVNILDGRVTLRELDPGTRERFWYYDNGRLERRNVNPTSSTAENGVDTEFTYDPTTGDLTKEFTENGTKDRETRYKNYAFGRPKLDEIEMGTADIKVNRDITPLGLVDWEEDGRQGTAYRTDYSYDSLGRTTGIEPPVGYDTTIGYLPDGSEVTVTRGPVGDQRRVKYTFDGFGRLRSWEDLERGDKRVVNYDAVGRKTQEAFFRGGVEADTHSFDVLGRLTEVLHPDSTSISYAYSGSTTTVTDERNHSTTLTYESFGNPDEQRLAQVRDAENSTWTYVYDPDKNLLKDINAPIANASRHFTYTTEFFLWNEDHPESGITSYLYSPAGDRTQRTLGGEVLQYTYDKAARLTRINDTASTTHDVDLDYNDAGLRTELSNGAASIVDVWDGAQRLTSRSVSPGPLGARTITFAYGGHDRLKQITYPSGRKVDYKYNAKGQLSSVEDPSDTDFLTSVIYTPAGDVDIVTYANGRATDYAYDTRFRPTGINAGTRSLALSYDDASNLTSWTGDGPARSFGYDHLNRLTTATGPGGEAIGYQYTKTGDRKERTVDGATSTYNYQASTQRLTSITGAGAISYSYDSAGRQTAAGSRGYTYTPHGAVEAITNPSRSFTYDGNGQRISRTDAQGTTYYVRDPSNRVLAEYDASGNLLREHVYALGRRIASILADGSRFYIQHDAQGSAWIVSDQVPQEAHGPYRYWPFGSEGSGGGGAGAAPEGPGAGLAATGGQLITALGAVGGSHRGETSSLAPTGEVIFADSFESGCVFAWHQGKPSTCGDGLVFPPEECDSTCFSVPDCEALGFDGGTLGCRMSSDPEAGAGPCTFDTSGCHLCGNNQAEGPEPCDGTDLAGETCQSLGFVGGSLACLNCAFDFTNCHNCGDGTQEPPEECDLTDFGGQTCVTRGFDGGSLLCTSGCLIDDTGCYVCGDNQAEGPEPCDGTDLAGETCQSQGFVGGELACIDCSFDTSACHNCGNQTLDPPEQCDPPDFGGEDCESQGYDGGVLGCTGSCTFDFSECYDCGNDIIEGPEVCDGEALGGVTCQDLGFDFGEPACLPGCDGFDVSGCFNDASAEPRFTGKELEPDLDLYYFGARYLDAGVGRFTVPDPGPFALENPQTFNRYVYALNGPYRFVDPDGREVRVLTPEALMMIRLTVPLGLRQYVQTDDNGLIKKGPLSRASSTNANLSALKELTLSEKKIEVTTAEHVRGTRFKFESAESLRAQFPQLVDKIKGPNLFLGAFQTAEDLEASASRVTVSDGAGPASDAPTFYFPQTMAHELYGHALLYVRGKPYVHPDPGVDAVIREIEDRTVLP